MRKIQKHAFEPVSLLTVENGVLNLAVIPAENQPDWLVPSSLILAIESYPERIWTYLWQEQEMAVYHLCSKQTQVSKLIVLEGNTDVHRLALQVAGEVSYIDVRISDVKDVVLSDEVVASIKAEIPSLFESRDDDDGEIDYLYQAVSVRGVTYLVPDLDMIVHRLVDLDS